MKVLITGGSGYFGTELNKYLTSKGHQVWSYDAGFFKDNWLGYQLKLNEEWVDSRDLTEQKLDSFDSVIHFAGISNDPLKQLSEDELHKPSVEYSYKIAKICKALNKQFIFASSCSVYGFSSDTVDEKSVTSPLTPYSKAKVEIENELNSLSDDYWQPIILRFATIFGFSSRMRFDTVINMLCGMAVADKRISLNSNGQAIRPFLYIKDACSVVNNFIEMTININYLLEENQVVVNVGRSNDNYTIKEVAETVCEVANVDLVDLSKQPVSLPTVFMDKKLDHGVDKRSYKVSFKKLETLSAVDFSKIDFKEKIELTLNALKHVGLDSIELKTDKYYRLQYLEKLIDTAVLDKSLRKINMVL